MAGFFRMEVKVVSRTAIRSNGTIGKNTSLNAAAYISAQLYKQKLNPINAAAYISGEQLRSESAATSVDYRSKKGVIASWILLPGYAPKELQNPEVLWNQVEQMETSNNADLFREFIICFDRHLTGKQRYKVANEFAQSLVEEGMIAHVALHDEKNGNGNYHMHILTPVRGINSDGFFDKYKTYPRRYLLDGEGKKIPVIDKHTGLQKIDSKGHRQWKREPIQYIRPWNDRRLDNVSRWRKNFCDISNKYLPEDYKITPDSYVKQGIEKIPGRHLGKAASNVHKKLEEQVNGLSSEKRQEFLTQILQQVKKEYRKAYYDNSRLLSANNKADKETEELRAEIFSELQKTKPYRPHKKYICSFSHIPINRCVLEYAFAELLYYAQHTMSQQQMYEQNTEAMYRFAQKILQAENDLIIMFTTGMTASMQNRLYQNSFEMQKEVLKELGAEIRQTEAEIDRLKEIDSKENLDGEADIESKLAGYRARIQAIRESQVIAASAGTGRTDSNSIERDSNYEEEVVRCANRIHILTGELERSLARMGESGKSIAKSAQRISNIQYRENAERLQLHKKTIKSTKKFQ